MSILSISQKQFNDDICLTITTYDQACYYLLMFHA